MSPKEEVYLDIANGYESQGEYEKAFTYYKKLQNNRDVCEIIGEHYYLGRGCEKDISKAKRYFDLAIENGNTDAMCNRSLCEEELDQKEYYYKMAAEQGCAYAMNMLGIIAEDKAGAGCDVAIEWFKKAADADLEIGCYNYAMNCSDDEERIRYLQKAVEKDYILAMETYIQYLEKGMHVEKNEEEALRIRKRLKEKQGM